jgi:ABC-type multidrug transport system permease subunit
MKQILLIGHTDLRVFLRAKASYIWLFVVPVVFIGFMGFAVRGPGDPSNARPTVLVDNRDTNFLAVIFTDELGTQGLRVLHPGSSEEAPQRIHVPEDFSERILSGEQAKVELSKKESEVTGEGAMVELRLVRALIGMNSALLVASARGETNLSEAAVREAQQAAPLVKLDARFAGRKPMPSGLKFSLPGNIVMYLMMNLLIFGGVSIAKARQNGLVRRLACHPLTRARLIAGKIYGLILLGGVQTAVFLLAGRFLFGIHFGSNLGAILLTLLVYAWVAASLGVLMGSLIQTEDKVVGLCIMISMLLGALGGCWWPTEIGPPILHTIANCLPSGWALAALHQLISFGGGFAEIVRPLATLAIFGLAANAIAAWSFRW